jgi:acyl carrier protein
MGRTGATTAEAREALPAMESAGAEVVVVQGDVTKEADVTRLVGEFGNRVPPLCGIIHAAMVLDDCLLPNLTAERLKAVLSPKIKGAWHLHRLTRDVPLDFFILFSSCSSILGWPGQGNYDCANAFLDALSWHRRSHGLPATSINWGFLGGVGYAARHEKVASHFENIGIPSFSPETALEILAHIMDRKPTQISVLNIDWPVFLDRFPSCESSPRFSSFAQGRRKGAESSVCAEGANLRRMLGTLEPSEALKSIEAALRNQIAKVLGSDASKLDVNARLTDLGFDSLMAVELRNWVESTMGIALRIMEIMRGPTIHELAESLCSKGDMIKGKSCPETHKKKL